MTQHHSKPLSIVTIIIMLLMSNMAAAATLFTVNQSPAFVDSATNLLLVSVPQEWFGTSVTATIGNDEFQVESIEGTVLGDDNSFTFNDITGSKIWTVTCNDGKTYNLQFTFLPIVSLQGDFGYDYTNGTVVLAEPGKPASEIMTATIKWRGATSNTPDKHKRNYSVKFVDANGDKQSRKLLNMRRDLTVQAVANMLGFDDQAVFSRYFHRETGLYPTEFREKN